MNGFSMGAYSAELQVALVRAKWIAPLVALGWIVFPFVLASLLHPADVINLHYVLQGEPKHKIMTAQQMAADFVEAVIALAVILLLLQVGIVLFYRHAQVHGTRIATPAIWPLAVLLPGVIGNALWFVFTRQFDASGLVIGLAPMAVTFFAERLCERLGRDFVFGPHLAGAH
jgi:hypothetical protein